MKRIRYLVIAAVFVLAVAGIGPALLRTVANLGSNSSGQVRAPSDDVAPSPSADSTVAYIGEVIFTSRFDGGAKRDLPVAVQVDGAGNTYVLGTSHGGAPAYRDIVLVKYAPDGREEWMRRYDGPGRDDDRGHNRDEAVDLAIDGENNIVIAGISYGGPAHLNDSVVIKYDSQGETKWTKRFDGGGNSAQVRDDYAKDLSIDQHGNIYLFGITHKIVSQDGERAARARPSTLVKYTPDGRLAWTKRFSLGYSGRDWKIAIPGPEEVGASRYIYLVGAQAARSDPDGPFDRVSVLRIDSAGRERSRVETTGPKTASKMFTTYKTVRAVRTIGRDVYLFGDLSPGNDPNVGFATWRFKAGEKLDWVRIFARPTFADYGSWSLDLAASADAVYVLGTWPDIESIRPHGGNIDNHTVIKYSIAGRKIWAKTFRTDQAPNADFEKVDIDADGNLLLAGTTRRPVKRYGEDYPSDIVTVKLDASGNRLWLQKYSGAGKSIDRFVDMTVDEAGNTYVTGTSYESSETGSAFVTIKYGP